jgi:secreted trypsin-like serine protease
MVRITFRTPRGRITRALIIGACVTAAVVLPLALSNAKSKSPPAVIGAVATRQAIFSFLAYIVDRRSREVGQCTGTVVAPTLILTAGHCVENVQTHIPNASSGFLVVIERANHKPSLSEVSRVVVYPGFTGTGGSPDAALLVLSKPTRAPPVRLATATQISSLRRLGAVTVVVGWATDLGERIYPTEKVEASIVVQEPEWCEESASFFSPQNDLCAIDPPSYKTGVCYGESGGPLVLLEGSSQATTEIGIVQRGMDNCSTHYPSIFTRTDVISSWVHTWIAAQAQHSSS